MQRKRTSKSSIFNENKHSLGVDPVVHGSFLFDIDPTTNIPKSDPLFVSFIEARPEVKNFLDKTKDNGNYPLI